jgi:hypothetical protein
MPDEQAKRIRFTFHPSHPSPELFGDSAPIFKLNRKRFQLNPSFFRQMGEMVGSSDNDPFPQSISVYHLRKNKKAWSYALSYDISPHQSIKLSI